jgi:diguanylate cyclase (GGDEF)-like protein/PAS domain S-box-containing protein
LTDFSPCELSHFMLTLPATLLLIENDPIDATLIQNALAHQEELLQETLQPEASIQDALIPDAMIQRTSYREASFRVVWVTSLTAALDYLTKNRCDIILLAFNQPDSKGAETFDTIFNAAPTTPIVILSGGGDDERVRAAIQGGAQDSIAKGHIDPYWLPRTLSYILERGASRRALVESEKRFQTMSEALPVGVFVSDAQGGCIYSNATFQRISGLTLEETLGNNWSSAIHPNEREQVLAELSLAVQKRKPFSAEVRFLRKDNRVIWVKFQAAAINIPSDTHHSIHHSSDNEPAQGYVQIVEDISERKALETIVRASEDALFDQRERAQVTLNSIGDAVLTTNLSGQVSYLNPVAEAMTGWSAQEALGLPLEKIFTVIDGDTRRTPIDLIARALKENKTVKLPHNCLLVRRDGSEIPIVDSTAPIHNRDGAVTGTVIVFHDVSEAHAVAKKLMHMAQHDVLTGLPNRALLTERLTRALGLAKRKRKTIALLFIDIDNFKHINDSRGHAMGDRLLQTIARRLESIVRVTDTVCRQGGDEFVVLLSEIEHAEDAAHVAEKMIAEFATPQLVHDQSIRVTLSIGISLYPHDGGDVDALFQRADAAMYRAKQCGRNNYQFFSEARHLGGGTEMIGNGAELHGITRSVE